MKTYLNYYNCPRNTEMIGHSIDTNMLISFERMLESREKGKSAKDFSQFSSTDRLNH